MTWHGDACPRTQDAYPFREAVDGEETFAQASRYAVKHRVRLLEDGVPITRVLNYINDIKFLLQNPAGWAGRWPTGPASFCRSA